MVSESSNRKSPAMVAHQQDLADVIGIFWQFHRSRIQKGNIQFAMAPDFDNGIAIPFTPQLKIDEHTRANRKPRTFKIITDFSEAVNETMDWSWRQFLAGLEMDHEEIIVDIPMPDSQQKFFTPFTKELAKRTNEGTKEHAKAHIKGDLSLEAVVYAGMKVGSDAPVQLATLFGELFHPTTAVLLSKVRMEDLDTALKEIGLPAHHRHTFAMPPGDYSLIDDSHLGLRRDRLRELGLGDALGCPAAKNVSPETRAFLLGNGIDVGRKTMLEDFAEMVPGQFKRYVGDWYTRLTPQEQERYVDPEQRRILSGEIRRTAIEHSRPARKEGL